MFDHAILFRKSLLLAAVFGLMIGTVGSVSLAQEEATATKEATATEATPPSRSHEARSTGRISVGIGFCFRQLCSLYLCCPGLVHAGRIRDARSRSEHGEEYGEYSL